MGRDGFAAGRADAVAEAGEVDAEGGDAAGGQMAGELDAEAGEPVMRVAAVLPMITTWPPCSWCGRQSNAEQAMVRAEAQGGFGAAWRVEEGGLGRLGGGMRLGGDGVLQPVQHGGEIGRGAFLDQVVAQQRFQAIEGGDGNIGA